MIPKTEPVENNPRSTSPLSVDAIVRDLSILEKSFISSRERGQNQLNIMQTKVKRLEFENSKCQTELEDMKSKIKLLEEQNSKLKSDLEASDLDKNLYYNQYQENGREFREAKITIGKLKKEVQELKIENQSLISKGSSNLTTLTDSNNDDNDVTQNMCGVVDDAPEWTRSKLTGQQKRKSGSESENEDIPKFKKPCLEPINLSWNCNICFGHSKFYTKAQLQDHIKQEHPLRAWFCERCPFTASKKSGLIKHQKLHTANELKFKDTENASKCKLCNVWFPPGSSLANHNKLYHCSSKDDVNDEKGTIDLGTSS